MSHERKAAPRGVSPETPVPGAAGRRGLPTYGERRRVPGLRREELALLAGVSASYYTRLEQGQSSNASPEVLDAIAGALDWTTPSGGTCTIWPWRSAARRNHGVPPEQVTAAARQLLAALTDVPAVVLGRRCDMLAWNRTGQRCSPGTWTRRARTGPRNGRTWRGWCSRRHTRELYADWRQRPGQWSESCAWWRAVTPDDAKMASLDRDLRAEKRRVRNAWADHRVKACAVATYEMRHSAGRGLDRGDPADPPGRTGPAVVVATTEPGSAPPAHSRCSPAGQAVPRTAHVPARADSAVTSRRHGTLSEPAPTSLRCAEIVVAASVMPEHVKEPWTRSSRRCSGRRGGRPVTRDRRHGHGAAPPPHRCPGPGSPPTSSWPAGQNAGERRLRARRRRGRHVRRRAARSPSRPRAAAIRVLATLPAPADGGVHTPVLGFPLTVGITRADDGTLYFLYATGTADLTGVWRLRPGGRPAADRRAPGRRPAQRPRPGPPHRAPCTSRTRCSAPSGGCPRPAARPTAWSAAPELAAGGFLGANGAEAARRRGVGHEPRPGHRTAHPDSGGTAARRGADRGHRPGGDRRLRLHRPRGRAARRAQRAQRGRARPGRRQRTRSCCTPADGLQNPTSVAVRGKDVYVLSAAYLTGKDPNLLHARLNRHGH